MFRSASLALTSITLVAACATGAGAPAGMVPGKFSAFTCEGGKTFQARLSEDRRSVRVRGHHGAAELTPTTAGAFEGEGYKLLTQAEGGAQLLHDNKLFGRACKAG